MTSWARGIAAIAAALLHLAFVGCSPDCSGSPISVGDEFAVDRGAFSYEVDGPDGVIPLELELKGWTFVSDGQHDQPLADDLDGATARLVSAEMDGASLAGARVEVRTTEGTTLPRDVLRAPLRVDSSAVWHRPSVHGRPVPGVSGRGGPGS